MECLYLSEGELYDLRADFSRSEGYYAFIAFIGYAPMKG